MTFKNCYFLDGVNLTLGFIIEVLFIPIQGMQKWKQTSMEKKEQHNIQM